MKIVSFEKISSLNISPKICVDWVRESFLRKSECVLPHKISIKSDGDIFFNTMPALVPFKNKCGVKIVSRYPHRNPSIQSELILYNAQNGEMLAIMDGTWITTMRTGAVAALAISTLKKRNAKTYAFMGLGNTARATLLCLINQIPKNERITVKLLAYKNQEDSFINRFEFAKNVDFLICENVGQLVSNSDVVVSCITSAKGNIAPNACFEKGVLLVPVHTRGFQNCDLFFDKVFADDTSHVSDFKYFDKFKKFDELSNVLLGKNEGRKSDDERILSYNIGIAIHDIIFAANIYDIIENEDICNLRLSGLNDKFWI